MRVCSNCGKGVYDNEYFCAWCGAQQSKVDLICPYCGKVLTLEEARETECENCGAPLNFTVYPLEISLEKCQFCGKQKPSISRICPQCGKDKRGCKSAEEEKEERKFVSSIKRTVSLVIIMSLLPIFIIVGVLISNVWSSVESLNKTSRPKITSITTNIVEIEPNEEEYKEYDMTDLFSDSSLKTGDYIGVVGVVSKNKGAQFEIGCVNLSVENRNFTVKLEGINEIDGLTAKLKWIDLGDKVRIKGVVVSINKEEQEVRIRTTGVIEGIK